jgi:class 3 adenylate cyclase
MGASDPVPLDALPSWEGWAEEAVAVLDAVESERAVVMGATDSGPTAIMFAATHPERTHSLVLCNSTPRGVNDDDYPWGRTPEEAQLVNAFIEEHWGTEEAVFVLPGQDDPEYLAWAAKNMRIACSPREVGAYLRQMLGLDVRQALPTVQVPSLVLHRKDASYIKVEEARYLAERIPNARLVEVSGAELMMYRGASEEILDLIESFVTGLPARPESERALAAILFTDIVGSTDLASRLGDREWRGLLEHHDAAVRAMVERNRGKLVKQTGDGVLATFEGPGRAIRCALSLVDALRPLGIEIRMGLHTGEIEVRAADIAGIGVHIAARALEHASAGELVVSAAVPMLVAGAGFTFEDRGEYELKGVPGTWRLYVVKE